MIAELIRKARSYRKFDESFEIDFQVVDDILTNLRFISSARNLQPLKYIVSVNKQINEEIFSTLSWAGYLRDWSGPEKGQRPTGYIVILRDRSISVEDFAYFDAGIAIQTVLLSLVEKGLGGCTIAAIDKPKLRSVLDIDSQKEILCVLALGKPREKIVVVNVKDGDIKYYRDRSGIHYVPKRSKKELIYKVFK